MLRSICCLVATLSIMPMGVAATRARVTHQAAGALAQIGHVFIIVFENKNYEETFQTSTQDPFLQRTLVPKGALLTHYYGTGHASLDNYISLISGQAATPDTVNDCLSDLSGTVGNFNDVAETGVNTDHQVIANSGCVYPAHVKTVVDQLVAAGLSWKGYMGDMGNDPARESATCAHPEPGIGTDNTNAAEPPSAAVPAGDAYTTRHNPFMYFHSIIDSPECQKHVVNLERHLGSDLAKVSTTPNLAFIAPNLCDDGHDGSGTGEAGTTCANGQPGGLTSIDAFLKRWVPKITSSPAYRQDGLLVITFDESNYTLRETQNHETGQVTVDINFPGEACCQQPPGPNLIGKRPSSTVLLNTPQRIERLVISGYGGDRVGALLLSPFIKPGAHSDVEYNHYSLLRTVEDIFGLTEHLGYAADTPESGYYLTSVVADRTLFRGSRAVKAH